MQITSQSTSEKHNQKIDAGPKTKKHYIGRPRAWSGGEGGGGSAYQEGPKERMLVADRKDSKGMQLEKEVRYFYLPEAIDNFNRKE